jgi:hypothetical protein
MCIPGDFDIILSEDQEGNGFREMWTFNVGHYDSKSREFSDEDVMKENQESAIAEGWDVEEIPANNAICFW